ncbi:MAG TPA: hypothetical protein VMS64_06705 [Candidatus Methylomirabilis sp.]|nr:hypothetical protein [Candidatus Methylomirabilis sp.]
MRVAAVLEDFDPSFGALVPWLFYRDRLAARGIQIDLLDANHGFDRAYDAMIPMVWLDWDNPRRFKPTRIMPYLEKYAEYRSRFPDVVQIVCNHIDMTRRPYATPYWRKGDPILYRTPPYDRREIAPFPEEDVWAYECIIGSPCLASDRPPEHAAGFIGAPSGPNGYRYRVAIETAKVGIGICRPRPIPYERYCALLQTCQIIVCPRGWGGWSLRHWEAWKSGKPVLTDAECAAVEMIPGQRLVHGIHYLVFQDPKDIPDIVSDWTRPSRREELERIGENGRRAAYAYDGLDRITRFFEHVAATKLSPVHAKRLDREGAGE